MKNTEFAWADGCKSEATSCASTDSNCFNTTAASSGSCVISTTTTSEFMATHGSDFKADGWNTYSVSV